jgi:hypothetical protein
MNLFLTTLFILQKKFIVLNFTSGTCKLSNRFDVRGFMHQTIIYTEKPTRCNSVSDFISLCLYEAQHVSGDTSPIITSSKLHWQPLVLHT